MVSTFRKQRNSTSLWRDVQKKAGKCSRKAGREETFKLLSGFWARMFPWSQFHAPAGAKTTQFSWRTAIIHQLRVKEGLWVRETVVLTLHFPLFCWSVTSEYSSTYKYIRCIQNLRSSIHRWHNAQGFKIKISRSRIVCRTQPENTKPKKIIWGNFEPPHTYGVCDSCPLDFSRL